MAANTTYVAILPNTEEMVAASSATAVYLYAVAGISPATGAMALIGWAEDKPGVRALAAPAAADGWTDLHVIGTAAYPYNSIQAQAARNPEAKRKADRKAAELAEKVAKAKKVAPAPKPEQLTLTDILEAEQLVLEVPIWNQQVLF